MRALYAWEHEGLLLSPFLSEPWLAQSCQNNTYCGLSELTHPTLAFSCHLDIFWHKIWSFFENAVKKKHENLIVHKWGSNSSGPHTYYLGLLLYLGPIRSSSVPWLHFLYGPNKVGPFCQHDSWSLKVKFSTLGPHVWWVQW